MKKLISVICALAILAGTMCIGVTAAKPTISFRLEAEPVYEGDTKLNASLIVTLPQSATGYELGSFGLFINYDPSVMELAEEPTWEVKGTTLCSEDLSIIPYMLLWVSIKPTEQYKPGDNLAATIEFDLKKPAVEGKTYSIDIFANEDNFPVSMPSKDGSYYEYLYDDSEVEFSGVKVVAKAFGGNTGSDVPDVPVKPNEPFVMPENAAVAFRLEPASPVEEGDTTIDVNLIVTLQDYASGYELGSFGIDMSYNERIMQLADEPDWQVKGTTGNSEDPSVIPYIFLWVSIKPTEQYKPGDNLAATMTFNLAEPAAVGDTYTIYLDVNDDNGVCSMASKDGSYREFSYSADKLVFVDANIAVENPPINYGDANDDGAVNIADASLMLKYIAKWEGLTINTDASDANADGAVNIADISLMLKYIAKWDGIVLGPQ